MPFNIFYPIESVCECFLTSILIWRSIFSIARYLDIIRNKQLLDNQDKLIIADRMIHQIHIQTFIWLGCCMRAFSMYKASLKVSPLEACTELISHAIGLKFWYAIDTDPNSKLAIGIGHLYSWAGFMAAQIWAINFVKNIPIYNVSAWFYRVATRWWQVVLMVSKVLKEGNMIPGKVI